MVGAGQPRPGDDTGSPRPGGGMGSLARPILATCVGDLTFAFLRVTLVCERERENIMSIQEILAWQPGATEETPLPPLVDPADLAGKEDLFLRNYLKLGPVFRVLRQNRVLTVLAGPEVNVFMARREGQGELQ
jgi:hypothetical protein